MKKQGVSPVIATVLLVAMVIVIALIIFLWFRGIGGEVITKFSQNIEIVCGQVEFASDYSNGELHVSNTGNVPIFGMKVRLVEEGSYRTEDIKDLDSSWPDLGLLQGGTFSSDLGGGVEISTESLVLIPVLLGNSDRGERAYVCNENQYGREIFVN